MNRIFCGCFSNVLNILYTPVYFLSPNLIRSDSVSDCFTLMVVAFCLSEKRHMAEIRLAIVRHFPASGIKAAFAEIGSSDKLCKAPVVNIETMKYG